MIKFIAAFVTVAIAPAALSHSSAHEIYTGLRDKRGQVCCGGADCAATTYRKRDGAYEFLTRENEWVRISEDHITFLPVPGDGPSDDTHRAHLCYRRATEADRSNTMPFAGNVFGSLYVYCAFIQPGSV